MSRTPFHPTTEQIQLPTVLDCLGDPIRLAIVSTLAQLPESARELRCNYFNDLGGKTNLTYHFTKLRDAGLVLTRLEGTNRYMQLRGADLEKRFPGLIQVIVQAAEQDAISRKSRKSSKTAS